MKSLPASTRRGASRRLPYVFAGRPLWLSALGADARCGNSNNFIRICAADNDRPSSCSPTSLIVVEKLDGSVSARDRCDEVVRVAALAISSQRR